MEIILIFILMSYTYIMRMANLKKLKILQKVTVTT